MDFPFNCRRGSKGCAALLLSAFFTVIVFLSGARPSAATPVDYEAIGEDPLVTVYRKLRSTGGLEWDEQEMTSGGAPSLMGSINWPMKTGEISSLFNRKRLKGKRRHMGIDIVAPRGTPIYAALDGIVEVISRNGIGFRGYGNVVVINHKNELWTLYAHCNSFKVKRGQAVKQGQQVASVGRTGRSTANHLHFEIRNAKGVALDPLKYLPKEGTLPFNLYRKK